MRQFISRPKGTAAFLSQFYVNFYENNFSTDVGNLLFGIKLNKKINFVSPDNTSDGWLLKKWIIKDGTRVLLKGGSRPYEQEPFN